MAKVEIITIGDEILIGQIVDTNSAWMAVELNKAGFEIVQITSVHDDAQHISSSLDSALQRADIVLFTGGIGPTNDDITKQTLCKYFNTRLVFDDAVYANIEHLLRDRQRAMNELTKLQAMVPETCSVIQNKVGTAPLTWFDHKGKVVVSMPGVPYEMKFAMTNEIIPRIKKQFKVSTVIHKTVIVTGYPESALAIKIAEWEKALPTNIHLAYLPTYSIIRLRLSGYSDDELSLDFAINQQVGLLCSLLGDAIIATDDLPLEVLVGQALKSKGLTLGTAESCTGGNIAHKITEIPGCSEYFAGSVVSYSNSIKVQILEVSSQLIELHGAVSAEVAMSMAKGARKILCTDVAVATTGIAGPDGGSESKPVGTVWIAVATPTETYAKQFKFGSFRIQNIERSTQAALLMLLENSLLKH